MSDPLYFSNCVEALKSAPKSCKKKEGKAKTKNKEDIKKKKRKKEKKKKEKKLTNKHETHFQHVENNISLFD